MISTLLLFPIIASIFMLIARKQILNKIMLNIYAVIHFIITTLLVFNNSITKSIPYFAVDNTNKIFLLILSFVFLMVTIYNNSYSKHLKPNEIIIGKTKIDLYWFMILAFVWAMTGTVLSTDLGIAWVFVEATTLSSAYLIFYNKTKNANIIYAEANKIYEAVYFRKPIIVGTGTYQANKVKENNWGFNLEGFSEKNIEEFINSLTLNQLEEKINSISSIPAEYAVDNNIELFEYLKHLKF